MRRLPKRLTAAIVIAAVAAAAVVLVVAVPAFRSSVATLAVKAVLKSRGGFTMPAGVIHIASDRIRIDGLEIDDAFGHVALTANRIDAALDPRFWLGRSDRRYGIESLDVDEPVIHLTRLADGSFNITPLLGGPTTGTQPAAPQAPLRLALRVRRGRLAFESPDSPAPLGRRFSIEAIDADGKIDIGAVSRLSVRARYEGGGAAAPIALDALENDRARFARAVARSSSLNVSPIIDGLVPTDAFALQGGVVRNVVIRAYAIDYDPALGPQWQIAGSGYLAGALVRVVPFTKSIHDVNGPLNFAGGNLGSPGLTGTLVGAPVRIQGGLELLGGVRIGLSVAGRQSLEALRHAFAFSNRLDIRGPVSLAARVDGPPGDVEVWGAYRSLGMLAYAGYPLSDVSGTFYYNAGHISLPRVVARYDGALVRADGDIDLAANVVAGHFAVAATMPADRLPIAANLNPTGTARALVELDGPLGALNGSGYADIIGGNATRLRTSFVADASHFSFGPALLGSPTGELMLQGAIDRTGSPRIITGEVIARRMSMHLISAARSLPGVSDGSPISLPAVDATLGGTVIVSGDERAPSVVVDAAGDSVRVSGTRIGHVAIVAAGNSGRVHISRISVEGDDVTGTASGDAEVLPASGRYAAILSGNARANLSALGATHPSARLKGSAQGAFSAALVGGRWTVSLQASSPDASVAGVGVRAVDASIGGGGGIPTDIYAASTRLAGGSISALGVVPAAAARSGDLHVWTDGFDVGTLAPLGVPLKRGRAIAFAQMKGSLAAPELSGAASVLDAVAGDRQFSGDVDLRYSGDRLVASDARIAVGGGFAQINGSVSGLGPGRPPGLASLSLDATMREGDLAALAAPYLPKRVRLAGIVAATLHVSGTLGVPQLDGQVAADGGTLQGVAFEGLHGGVHVSSGSVQVNQGAVDIASSHFDFSGSLSPSALHMRASSSRVDLSDFNDFFEGYDTLEGAGRGTVAFESTRTGVLASGHVVFSGTNVAGFPLGTLDADFASRRDEVLAHVRQSGDAGSSDVRGSVVFAPRASALPDLRLARYDVRGALRNVDIGRVTPLIGRENVGLTGFVNVNGFVRGNLRAPQAHADFDLRDGHIRKIAIVEAHGSLDTDGTRILLRDASVALPFARVSGDGALGPGKRLAASFGVDASDLGSLLAALGSPGVANGTALASVSISGTTAAPHVKTSIVSGHGSAYGIAFDRLSGTVSYGPGEVDIADTQLDLAGKRGTLRIGGTLPLQLAPFGLGPKNKSVDLNVSANAVDLSAFDTLAASRATLAGTLDAQVTVNGTAGRPQVTGSARLRGASVSSPLETVAAEHVDADLSLARDTLTLTRLGGTLGRGSFTGSGAVHIVPAAGLLTVAGLQYWTRLDLHGAQIDVPGWVSGSASGDLRLTKSGATPFLSGDLTLDDGTVPFSAIYQLASGYGGSAAPPSGPLPGVPELRPGHIIVYGGTVFGGGGPFVLSAAPGAAPTPAVTRLPSVDLAVTTRAGKNVRVHGGAIDLTATGSLVVGGNLHDPTLAGAFTSTRGQVGYFDTNFRLVRGTVTFDPTEGLLPTLDVKAITNLGGSEITLLVTGRVDNLQTELSSSPSMSRDEIVATLLHAPQVASVFGGTSGQAQSQIYTEAQNYFNAQLSRSLLFPVESLLAQSINVEQISLIYDVQGKVDVEVRKLITPTVYAIYRSSLNIPVTQTAGVAYSLRDYADLEILQTQSPTGLQQTVLNLRLTFH